MSFDLEKARALAYQASEFKVWTPPGATGHGSDLNKYREWQAVVEICDKRYPEALDQITDLMQNCNSLRARAQKAEAEIERLRAELTRVNKLRETEIDQAGAAERIYLEGVRLKDARIQELEDALAEYQRLGKTIAGKVPCLALHGDCGRCSAKMREVCGALEQIAGGKIGPDAKQHDHTAEFFRPNESPAKSWQITDERILAIENAISSSVLIERHTGLDLRQETTALRAMLKEVGQ